MFMPLIMFFKKRFSALFVQQYSVRCVVSFFGTALKKSMGLLIRTGNVSGFVLLLMNALVMAASVNLVDDVGRSITLPAPAQRIISLAPHITENLFTAGAGENLVGVVEYSDYPAAARTIASVGNSAHFNLEAIVQLQPDLVVAWASGNGMAKIQPIIDLGIPVFIAEPIVLKDIASNIQRYGLLTGHQKIANQASKNFLFRLNELKKTYGALAPVSVFYQVWNHPLHTIGGDHVINNIIQLCSGHNVFSDLSIKAPQINMEAMLVADPEVIVASGTDDARPEWLDDWYQWPSIRAVKNDHLFFIPPDYLQRHTVRILEGAAMLCSQLDSVRKSNQF